MENTQLPWSDLSSGYGLEKRLASQNKLGLVLLISSKSDADHCCAKNYERTLFRSPKVVKYAKRGFVPIRLDRGYEKGQELYARYELKKENPAVLVVDQDGDLLYKTQLCTEPRDCLKGMQTAVLLTRKRLAYTSTVEKQLAVAREEINHREYRDALIALGRINEKLLTLPLREKLARYYGKLESDARKWLRRASRYEKKNDLDRAGRLYRKVARSFSRMEKAKERAEAGLERILKKQKLQESRA